MYKCTCGKDFIIPLDRDKCFKSHPKHLGNDKAAGPDATVTHLHKITTLDLPADDVLKGNIGKLKSVVVLGYDHEDNEYFATSFNDAGATIWLLERFKLGLLRKND